MAKYKFSQAERFAVWRTHSEKCFWCAEPLALQDTTVDHVLPESLLDDQEKLERTKTLFGLEDDFKINGFGNWVPAHSSCNSQKRASVFKASEVMLAILERLARKAEQAATACERIKNNKRIGEALARVQVLYDEEKITKDDLIAIFSDSDIQEQKLQTQLEKLIKRVDDTWQIVGVSNGMATVTDGRRGGITPVGENVHHSWECPTCGSYGPWNGARCMTCGQMSDGW